jgi:predicted dehydrogenase
MTPLRLGFIGAGGNTRLRHLPGFRALPDVVFTVVANRSRASSERVAAEFGIASVAEDWREVIERSDVDAICIGTWPYLHAEITIAALQAGKHVLTEARMARDAHEAAAMLDASRAAPTRVAQIVPAPLTLSFDFLVRTEFIHGRLGELREIEVMHTHGASADPNAPLTWRQRADFSGHNLLTLGIHYEALLRWLDDDADVQAVQAARDIAQRRDETGRMRSVDVPDAVTVLGHFRRTGTRLRLHLSAVETTEPRHEIRLHGRDGGLRIDVNARQLWFTPLGGQSTPVPLPDPSDDGWHVEADFVASIREGRPVTRTDFATGLRYMQFTDAVWSAAQANLDANQSAPR